DWSERYQSTSQYVWDAIKTLPFIVSSQTRRTFRIELFLAEACVLYAAFTGAFVRRGLEYLNDKHAFSQLIIIVVVELFALTIGGAYANPRDHSRRNVLLPVGLALTSAYCVEAILRVSNPSLMLPAGAMFIGTALSLPMLIIARKWYAGSRHRRADAAANN